jgi:glycosyltransferase involved in cell wall biosynthesis
MQGQAFAMTWPPSAATTIAALILLAWLVLAWEVSRGTRRMVYLAKDTSPVPKAWPRVSIVFSARNEGATIGAAVPTMLALDYPDFEVIAVNDRSEDATGEVLDRLAAQHARLQVVHIRELPAGWIGKNNALHAAAARATGKWILFTDADIHFSADALRRAVAYAEHRELDLLAAVPRLHERGHLLGICVHAFSCLFVAALRPWRIPDPRIQLAHGSVGAFGMVRTETYRRLGGHERIRLRPDDDIKLGKLFKLNGARCDFVFGQGAISVAWYENLGQMIRGLTKNAFAGADYRWYAPVGFAAVIAVFIFWPLAALLVVSGAAWWLYLAVVVIALALSFDQTRFTGVPRWYALVLPFGLTVFAHIMLRSMVVTYWTRGITWRGTHYPLGELRKNQL